MAGEGRGHAVRVRAMVEELRREHQLVLLAPDEAHDFLAPLFPAGSPGVELRRIPGLRFHYTRGRLDLAKTLMRAAVYHARLPELVAEMSEGLRAAATRPRHRRLRAGAATRRSRLPAFP